MPPNSRRQTLLLIIDTQSQRIVYPASVTWSPRYWLLLFRQNPQRPIRFRHDYCNSTIYSSL